MIADHMQECWWYVLWISGPRTGSVSLMPNLDPDAAPPIGTFVEFLVAYLADAPSMYPP